jgi:hypothetical protein
LKAQVTKEKIDKEYRNYVWKLARIEPIQLPNQLDCTVKERFLQQYDKLQVLNYDQESCTTWLVRSTQDQHLYSMREIEEGEQSQTELR